LDFACGGPQEEALDGAAGGAGGVEAGGDDGGVVAEEGVAGLEVFRQVAEVAVLQAARLPADDEQARLIPSLRRHLSNQTLGEVVVEEIGGKGHGGKAGSRKEGVGRKAEDGGRSAMRLGMAAKKRKKRKKDRASCVDEPLRNLTTDEKTPDGSGRSMPNRDAQSRLRRQAT
jgi:hypothetical protein